MIDHEVIEITLRSITVSGSATLLALTWCIPIAYILAGSTSRISKAIISILNALVGLPTVTVGLLLYMIFSRSGPLGFLNMLYTPIIISIGQAILITPLLISLLYEIYTSGRSKYWELALTLGATRVQASTLVIVESLPQTITAILIGFGRAIGELGVALMVGGNIRGYTRVLTTSIALEVEKGEFEKALILGAILLAVVLMIVISVRIIRVKVEGP